MGAFLVLGEWDWRGFIEPFAVGLRGGRSSEAFSSETVRKQAFDALFTKTYMTPPVIRRYSNQSLQRDCIAPLM